MNTESVFNEIESTAYIIGGLFFLAIAAVCAKTAYDVLTTHPSEHKRLQDEIHRDKSMSSWLSSQD